MFYRLAASKVAAAGKGGCKNSFSINLLAISAEFIFIAQYVTHRAWGAGIQYFFPFPSRIGL